MKTFIAQKSYRKTYICIVAAVLMVLTVAAGKVSAQEFKIDNENSTATFEIRHVIGFNFGQIQKIDGTIKLKDIKKGKYKTKGIGKLEVNVDMASLNSFNETRDSVMKSEKFFNIEKYPMATLKSKKVKDELIEMEVMIRGVKRVVNFQYRFWGVSEDDKGIKRANIFMFGNIGRKDFGIEYNPLTEQGKELLGEEIEIMLDLIGIEG